MTESDNHRQRILLLAASLEDYLPDPWHGRAEFSGEAPSERRRCGRCQGEGSVRTRRGSERCEACAGRGVVDVDSYTGRVIARVQGDGFALSAAELRETLRAEDADAEARRRRRRRVDFLLREEREGEDWVDWVLRRRAQLWRSGDYARLEGALGLLLPRLVQAFLIVYGPRAADREPGLLVSARAGHALERLEELLPPPVRVPWWLEGSARPAALRSRASLWWGRTDRHGELRAERRRGLAERRRLGWSVSELSAWSGLGRSQVYELLASEGLGRRAG